jgi:hypothetical protein
MNAFRDCCIGLPSDQSCDFMLAGLDELLSDVTPYSATNLM